MAHKFGHEELLPSGNTRFRWDLQGVHHSEMWPKSMTRAERKERKAQLELECCRERYGRRRIPTYAELWESDVLPTVMEMADTTRDSYLCAWSNVSGRFGNVKVTDLIAADVMDWLKENPGSANIKSVVLRKVSLRAAQLGYTKSDMLASVKEPKRERRKKSVVKDSLAYLEAVKGSPIECSVLLMLGAGLRVGEALSLSVTDVDISSATVFVHDTVGRKDGDLKGRTKTSESTGIRPIAPDVMPMVAKVVESKVERGETWVADNGFGEPIGLDSAGRMWARLTSGLPKATMRSLRNTFATRALDAGVTTRSVNIAMGHTSLSHVLQAYDLPDRVDPLPQLFS